MIISRKKFQEAIEAAKKEGAETVYKDRYMEDSFRNIHERIDRLDDRLAQVENKNPMNSEKSCGCRH